MCVQEIIVNCVQTNIALRMGVVHACYEKMGCTVEVLTRLSKFFKHRFKLEANLFIFDLLKDH